MKCHFEAVTRLVLEPNQSTGKSRHTQTDIYLEVSNNLNKDNYVNDDGSLTTDGSRAFTNTLVQGLIANIHASHQAGYIDSAEHLRMIIRELERGFIQQVKVENGTY